METRSMRRRWQGRWGGRLAAGAGWRWGWPRWPSRAPGSRLLPTPDGRIRCIARAVRWQFLSHGSQGIGTATD
jgi:hypothetical protein